MHIGMLWYDNDPTTTLAGKIQKAAEYYRGKYHKDPTHVVVARGAIGEGFKPLEGIEVTSSQSIQPGHLWIGVELERAQFAPAQPLQELLPGLPEVG